jgi:hypothetical protein
MLSASPADPEKVRVSYWTADEAVRDEIRASVSGTVVDRIYAPGFFGGQVAQFEVLALPEGVAADGAVATLSAETFVASAVAYVEVPPVDLPVLDPPAPHTGPDYILKQIAIQYRAGTDEAYKAEVRAALGGTLVRTGDPLIGPTIFDGGTDILELADDSLVDGVIAKLKDDPNVLWVDRYGDGWFVSEGGARIIPFPGDSIALYDPATATTLASNVNSTGYADMVIPFGPTNGDGIAIAGDWNGDGVDTPGLYQPATSTFWLTDGSSEQASQAFGFGEPGAGWQPIVGDWNGDGVDTVGLFAPESSHFYLRNSHTAGYADVDIGFGVAGALQQAMAGDWDGDGVDTIGLFSQSDAGFALRNSNTTGFADLQFGYGDASRRQTPLAGDWNSDGRDTVGLYDAAISAFLLRDTNDSGFADRSFGFGVPGAGWQPVAGDWDGSDPWN